VAEGRVLVTGGRGFIGRHALAGLVARGRDVHALVRPGAAGAPVDGVTWWEADLGDGDAVRAAVERVRPCRALHLAWAGGAGRVADERANRTAAEQTIELAALLGDAGCRHLVLAGSCIEAQCGTAAGRTPYAVAKRAVHEALVGGAAGCPATCAHIFSTFGPGEPSHRLVPRLIRALVAGEPVAVSSGRQMRDFLAVEDVADALALVLDRPPCGQIDICSGTGRPLADLFDALERATAARPGLLRRGAAKLAPWQLFDALGSSEALEAAGWRPALMFEAAVQAAVDRWSVRDAGFAL
jgi:UDP-glucuronate decarboxylase